MDSKKKKIIKILNKSASNSVSFCDLSVRLSKVDSGITYSRCELCGLSGFEIQRNNEKMFYIEHAANRGSMTLFQRDLNKRYCPPPFFIIGEGRFRNEFYKADTALKFNNLIYSIFTPVNMATIYNQFFRESPVFSKHRSIIFEAMEAYWMGLDYISTDSIISVFESALREIIHKAGFDRPGIKFQKHIRDLAISRLESKFIDLNKYSWYPFKSNNFNHARENRGTKEEEKFWVLLDVQMDAINAILIWFSGVLYKECDSNGNSFSLNRHDYFHGFSSRKAVPVYFPLMIWSLLSLSYIECLFVKSRSLFFPEAGSEDIALASYFDQLIDGVSDNRRNLVNRYGVSYKCT